MSDCCLTLNEQFFNYFIATRSYISIRWWWCPLCTRPTLCIVLAHWNNCLRVSMSLHSDTLSCFPSQISMSLHSDTLSCFPSQVSMSLHSDTLSCFPSQVSISLHSWYIILFPQPTSLCFYYLMLCLTEKQQILILSSLSWPGPGSNSRFTTLHTCVYNLNN